MKVIIAGSRDFNDYEALVAAIKKSGFEITEVVSGKAKGVDALGEKWAKNYGVPVTGFSANWKKYGRSAGPIRNKEMAEYGEALIAIRCNNSIGTTNMIHQMKKLNKNVFVVDV